MKYFLFLFCICSTVSLAQKTVIVEIKMLPDSRYFQNRDSNIIYPIINTGNEETSKLINDEIANQIFTVDEEFQDVRAELEKRVEEGLIDVSYQVSLMKNGILSIQVRIEGCGAYCSISNFYFNFDLKTGKSLTFSDIINDPGEKLQAKIFADKKRKLEEYKKNMKRSQNNKQTDSSTCEWAIEIVDRDCFKSPDITRFILSTTEINIVDHCSFPHAIRSQEPDFDLNYPYKTISEYLIPEIRKRMYQ